MNTFLVKLGSKSGKLGLLVVLFLGLFSAPALARETATSDRASINTQLNSDTLIANRRVYVDRSGRHYILNRNGRQRYVDPYYYDRGDYHRSYRRYRRNRRDRFDEDREDRFSRDRFDRFGRRIYFDRRGRRYIIDGRGRRLYI